MNKSLLFLLLSLFINNTNAQNSLVKQWDYRFGGTMFDYLWYFEQTPDGGFILGGSTSSDSAGEKTNNTYGSIDFWIVKTDANGIKQWDLDYGGTEADFFTCGDQTSDGGFIFGGYTESGISGNKTQPNVGDNDYWIIKVDAVGNVLWDKSFGGTGDDRISSVEQTSDGGYILGGSSESPISGDKSENVWGASDYWIIKTDASGNKVWDKDFGGTLIELRGITTQTTDHGYIIGGYSDSPISGNKTQNTWGSSDYWLVKTDSLGNFLWDKNIGGPAVENLKTVKQTRDGGFILGGKSDSGIGGDKTQAAWNNTEDFWIVKTNAIGNIQWDKVYGGTDIEDEFWTIQLTQDKGYLLGGNSYSDISGEKSENDLGLEQTWTLKIDSLGNKLWDKTSLTSGHDEVGLVLETPEGCIVIANSTDGGVAGEKTSTHWGQAADYWIIKYCDSLLSPHAGLTAPHHICPGTCADFLNLSTYATSYLWSFPGAQPSSSTDINPANICYNSPGAYDVSLIAFSSFGSDTITLPNYVIVYPLPPPQGILQSGDTLTANQGSTSYQWFYNGNIINGATDYFYVAPQSGNYSVVATDNNGCEVEAVINNVIANTNQLAMSSWQLAIVPNPVTSTIYIRGLENNSADEIKIFNVFGENVFSAVHCQLPIANFQLSSGIYYLEITADKKTYRAKFVKE
jgi:hypothetical protein